MNLPQKQFSLNRAATKKQIPIILKTRRTFEWYGITGRQFSLTRAGSSICGSAGNRLLLVLFPALVTFILLSTSSYCSAQFLTNADWVLANEEFPMEKVNGATAVSGNHEVIEGQWASWSWDTESTIVFSVKGFTYDENGWITNTESVFRPSAQIMDEFSSAGDYFSVIDSQESYVNYYGMLMAAPGAPQGAAVPLKIALRGSASATSYATGYGTLAVARAQSVFAIPDGVTYTQSVFVGTDQGKTADEYELLITNTVTAGSVFYCSVDIYTAAVANYPYSGVFNYSLQAIADPDIEIDPAYPYKSFFTLQYSTNIMFEPSSPLSLALTGVTNGIATVRLDCPTNNVYEVDASSDLASNNWQPIAEVTNINGTVYYTDSRAGCHTPQFYRAKALRRFQ